MNKFNHDSNLFSCTPYQKQPSRVRAVMNDDVMIAVGKSAIEVMNTMYKNGGDITPRTISIGTSNEFTSPPIGLNVFVRDEGLPFPTVSDDVLAFFLSIGTKDTTFTIMCGDDSKTVNKILSQLFRLIALQGSSYVVLRVPVAVDGNREVASYEYNGTSSQKGDIS